MGGSSTHSKQPSANRVNRRISPALVVEAAGGLKVLKVGRIGLAAPEVEVADLEIAPEVALFDDRRVSTKSRKWQREGNLTDVVILLTAIV